MDYGFYAIVAVNEEGCLAFDTVEIEDARVAPTFTVSTTPNNACVDELNNGKITFAPANYTNFVGGEITTSPVTALADGPYYIVAIDPTTYCRKDTIVNVELQRYMPVVTVDSIISNTSCDPERLAYNGGIVFNVTAEGNNANIYNNYIKNYSIQIDEVVHNGGLIYFDSLKTDSDIASHVHTVGGLNENHYRWTVISKYGCAVEGDTVVTHKHIDPMELTMIPNHYCGPMGTTKPGNG